MMTMTESSTHSISTGIATLTMTQTFTPSTVHFTEMTDQTQSILISTETALKTTSIGMMTTMVFPISMTQMTVIAALLITMRMIISEALTTLLPMVETSMAAKTALLTQIMQPTIGTSFSGIILSPTSYLITMAMTQQPLRLRAEQCQNTIGSCLLVGHLTTVATTGTSIQTATLFPTD